MVAAARLRRAQEKANASSYENANSLNEMFRVF